MSKVNKNAKNCIKSPSKFLYFNLYLHKHNLPNNKMKNKENNLKKAITSKLDVCWRKTVRKYIRIREKKGNGNKTSYIHTHIHVDKEWA